MTTRHRTIARVASSLVALAAATLTTAQLAPAAQATPYRDPVTTGLPDPGVVVNGNQWVSLSTGNWDGLGVGTAPSADGPWTVDPNHRLLTAAAGWMYADSHKSVWAPSVIASPAGGFVVYFAGIVKGTDGRRCIGTGTSANPAGPFVPSPHPVACWKGSGTSPGDAITNEGRDIGLIDPTPAAIDGRIVLTYKTEHKGKGSKPWHTTTRLLNLNPADPTQAAPRPDGKGGSIKISDSRSTVIEENPVLVKHGSRYTLFTSYGLFGRCQYATRYRQNDDLWKGWRDKQSKKATTLKFPMGKSLKKQTCGTGNAQVIQIPGTDGWRIFFNGHLDHRKDPHAVHTPRGPQGLYIATVTWPKGKPHVGTYVKP